MQITVEMHKKMVLGKEITPLLNKTVNTNCQQRLIRHHTPLLTTNSNSVTVESNQGVKYKGNITHIKKLNENSVLLPQSVNLDDCDDGQQN